MAHFLAAFKGATAIGYAVGAFAIALLAGVGTIAKNTVDTKSAVVRHDSSTAVQDGLTVARDTALLAEVRAAHRDQNLNAQKERCILVADTKAEKRACERAAFVSP